MLNYLTNLNSDYLSQSMPGVWAVLKGTKLVAQQGVLIIVTLQLNNSSIIA